METDKLRQVLEEHSYTLIDALGKGSFSRCYRVLSQKYNKEFVCKTMETMDLFLEKHIKDVQDTYVNEINSLSNLTHSSIIHIYDHFTNGKNMYVILEYCPGGTLEEKVKKEKAIPPPLIYTYIFQIASAIMYMHSMNIVHHDLNPGNIFIGENDVPKLADFGLSCKYEKPVSKSFRGTMKFIAPEMLSKDPYDPFKAEVWAFGVTIYYLAVGSLPFDGHTFTEIKNKILSCKYTIPDNVDGNLRIIISECLDINPMNRPTMAAIVDEIHKNLPIRRQRKQLSKLGPNISSIKMKTKSMFISRIPHIPVHRTSNTYLDLNADD